MMHKIAISILASLILAGQAIAHPVPCQKTSLVISSLLSKYGEHPVSIGLEPNGTILQVFKSKTKNTWTVVRSSPKGVSCIIASGRLWENVTSKSADPEA